MTYFQKELGPGMLQYSVQYAYNYFKRTWTESRHSFCAYLVPLVFLQRSFSLNAGLERSRSDLVFKQPRLRKNLIFGMFYSVNALFCQFFSRKHFNSTYTTVWFFGILYVLSDIKLPKIVKKVAYYYFLKRRYFMFYKAIFLLHLKEEQIVYVGSSYLLGPQANH